MQWGLCTCDKNLAEEADTHAQAYTHTHTHTENTVLLCLYFCLRYLKSFFQSLLIHTSGQTALNVCFKLQLL